MWYVLSAGVGLVVGAVVAWLVASSRSARQCGALGATVDELRARGEARDNEVRELQAALGFEREGKTEAETRLRGTEERLDEERKLLEEAKSRLTDTFKALAGEALTASTQDFLQLAKGTLEKVLAEAKGDFGRSEEAIRALVGPLHDALKRHEEHIRTLESSRQEAYGGLVELVKTSSVGQEQLRRETANLVRALRTPQVRGRWGELTLRRTVELAGMSAHCDFTEQVTAQTEEGRVRPDLVVHLPAGREIVVDAKVPLDAYLDAIEAEGEEVKEKALSRHARQFRDHMTKLGGKAYWEQFPQSPEFVVMFVPGESFFAAAVDADRALIEDGMQRRVIVVTPATLVTLLLTVAFGWRQEQVAQNAQEISDLGRQLYERMAVLVSHLAGMRDGLEKASNSYNSAVGSLESRVLPAARRFRDLGAASGEEIPPVKPVEVPLRAANPRSLPEPGGPEARAGPRETGTETS